MPVQPSCRPCGLQGTASVRGSSWVCGTMEARSATTVMIGSRSTRSTFAAFGEFGAQKGDYQLAVLIGAGIERDHQAPSGPLRRLAQLLDLAREADGVADI